MPKIVDYAERRRQIAKKATSVFAQEGFRDANLSRIAELCGFGRTTIYKYFKDKDEIFLFVLDGIFARLDAEAAAIVEDGTRGAIAKLEALLGAMMRDSIDDRDSMLIVLDLILDLRREETAWTDDVRGRIVRLQAYYERVLREGLDSGELSPCDPAALASVIFAILESFVLQHSLFGVLAQESVLEAARLLIEGLRA